MVATKFVQPMDFSGVYKTGSWAGYVFKDPLGYTTGRHTGVDYNFGYGGNDDLGQPVRSVASGIVRYVGDHTSIGFGRTVIIEHPLHDQLKAELGCDSLFSRYMHLQRWDVTVGQEVSVGQAIGTCGNSGTTWAHLHLDLYKSTISGGGVHLRYDKDTQLQSYLDPYEFIQAHLNDIAPALQPFQRVVGSAGVNYRKAPGTSAEIIKEFLPGEILDFKGHVRGGMVGDNNIWFVGKYTNGYAWSGSFEDTDPHDLPNITEPTVPAPTPEPKPAPTPPPTYKFTKDLPSVTEVIPAALTNFEYGNFPAKPEKVVIHDFGTKHVDTVGSVLNHFQGVNVEVSAHFVISGKRKIQMVSLKDRAYHAGKNGNNFVGIEADPEQDSDTIASVQEVLKDLKAYYGHALTPILHSDIMPTQCGDDIDLDDYQIDQSEEDYDKENNGLLKQILAIVTWIKNKIEGIFK